MKNVFKKKKSKWKLASFIFVGSNKNKIVLITYVLAQYLNNFFEFFKSKYLNQYILFYFMSIILYDR